MDREHLHLLINEEIYVIPNSINENVTEPVKEAETVLEPDNKNQEKLTIHVSQEELDHEHHDETPKIPEVHHEPVSKPANIPFAIFHESSDSQEIDLLQKIIGACNLEPDQFQVFANGFNREVKFDKALVFVPQAKAFYEPIPYNQSQFLCSKPLSILISNQHEKGLLWSALKQFL